MRGKNQRARWRVAAALGGALAIEGCVSPPESTYDRLQIETPETYSAAPENATQAVDGWLADFESAALESVVDEAIETNPSLSGSAYRVRASRAAAMAGASGLWPLITGGYRAAQNKRATNIGFVINNPVAETLGLDGTLVWELDLWGKFRNQAKAAYADFEVSESEYYGARLALAGQTARAWFNAVEAKLQEDLAERVYEAFRDNVAVVEEGLTRGVYNALDVRLTRSSMADALSAWRARERQLDTATRSLEILLGRYPGREIELANALPVLTAPPPAGLVSDMLRRRPDVAAAERRLAAALQRAKQASKDRLPTLSLTASGGTSTPELRDSLDPEANVWSLAANLTAPLFEGGRRAATYRQRTELANAAAEDFRDVALQALREVESALAGEVFLREQNQALDVSVVESKEADSLAWSRFQRGLSDIVTVLDAQRRAVNAESALIQVKNQRLQNRIDLYLALGGSFELAQVEAESE